MLQNSGMRAPGFALRPWPELGVPLCSPREGNAAPRGAQGMARSTERASGSSTLRRLTRRSQPVLLAAAPEGGLVDAEDGCGLAQGAGLGKDSADVLLLDLGEGGQVA